MDNAPSSSSAPQVVIDSAGDPWVSSGAVIEKKPKAARKLDFDADLSKFDVAFIERSRAQAEEARQIIAAKLEKERCEAINRSIDRFQGVETGISSVLTSMTHLLEICRRESKRPKVSPDGGGAEASAAAINQAFKEAKESGKDPAGPLCVCYFCSNFFVASNYGDTAFTLACDPCTVKFAPSKHILRCRDCRPVFAPSYKCCSKCGSRLLYYNYVERMTRPAAEPLCFRCNCKVAIQRKCPRSDCVADVFYTSADVHAVCYACKGMFVVNESLPYLLGSRDVTLEFLDQGQAEKEHTSKVSEKDTKTAGERRGDRFKLSKAEEELMRDMGMTEDDRCGSCDLLNLCPDCNGRD